MLKNLKSILKTIFSDVRRTIIGLIVVAVLSGAGGILYLSKTVLSFSIATLNIPTPLWATIALVLLSGLYIYLKTQQSQNPQKPPNVQEELHEEFGVYWNNQYKLRCLKCKWPLKCASKGHDPSLFWCSNCNTKFALRDLNGNPLTEANAIGLLKKVLTSEST